MIYGSIWAHMKSVARGEQKQREHLERFHTFGGAGCPFIFMGGGSPPLQNK